jgi:hypothetical protein
MRLRHRVAIPTFLQRRHTDEFSPPDYTQRDRSVISRVAEEGPETARRTARALGDYWAGRNGTAAGLIEIDRAAGGGYYTLPREAGIEPQAAEEVLGGGEFVMDVQTHFVSDRREAATSWYEAIQAMYKTVAPDWWGGVDSVTAYDMAEYLRCVFLESETSVAVLTSGPGLEPERMLFNREMAATRELLDRLGADGRLLNHCVIHADVAGEIEGMERERDSRHPVGWKVYTMGATHAAGVGGEGGWYLDDEATGVRFLENARSLGVPLVCAHKGISQLVPTGSPRDVGPAAKAFSDINFVIYHSGYEFPLGEAPEEGPFLEETADVGVNRLVKSLRDAGVVPGANVFAELGTTWFCLIRRPEEAAHVLGKLLLAVGEDNVIWGTDSIWYGPTQVSIDAFRAFQIPAAMREEFGYPELTAARKAKILGLNAARIYGVDPAEAQLKARSDDTAWVQAALREYAASGSPGR